MKKNVTRKGCVTEISCSFSSFSVKIGINFAGISLVQRFIAQKDNKNIYKYLVKLGRFQNDPRIVLISAASKNKIIF